MRKNLAAFDKSKFEKGWGAISAENQTYIRKSLLEVLHREESASVRMMCADAIGEIGGSIMRLDKNNWPKFGESVFVLLNDSNPNNIASALSIFETFFNYYPDYFANQAD